MSNLDRRKFLGATALGGAALLMKNTEKNFGTDRFGFF